MDLRKPHKKGQVAPEDTDQLMGSDNNSFQMDEASEKVANNTRGSLMFKKAVQSVKENANPFKVIANVKQTAAKWKNYTSTRRVRRQPVIASENGNVTQRQTGGAGLDDIHEDFISFSSHQESGKKKVKKDFEMSMASNRALIQYFAKLGQSRKDDECINLDFVHTLVSSGADINCTDKYGQTVLHEVARSWHCDVAKFLIEHGADINKGDSYGRTPLHVASAVDYPEMVILLIDNGADKESLTKGENQTPVFYAAKTDAVASLKALLDKGCLFKEVKDYKGRTPIHVAAELDRSETARYLLEQRAPVWIPDASGSRAITWMITKMAPVANEALKQFHLTDRPNRKQYFFLNHLVRDKEKDPQGKAATPLHVAVGFRQFDILMHPVFVRLLDVQWNKFGRFWALFNLCINFLYILLWTIIGIAVEYDERYLYKMPDDIWRIVLFISAIALTCYQVYDEIMEYRRSQKAHSDMEAKRKAEIERDLEYCHPQWPEEKNFLESELGETEKLRPKYFSDYWNIFDWLCYFMLFVCIATHIADIISHSDSLARVHIRFMTVTVIILWLRLMKNARAFSWIGPFIVMLGHMLKDCCRFLFLYMEFYIPYLAAFWMIFGGTKKSESGNSTVQVSGYVYPGQTFFSMLRLTLVDDYDYDGMHQIDSVMTDLLLATWFIFSSILCLNLFIALLSDTFQRVYDNAQANAVMQKAITILNIWEGINTNRKERFLAFIENNCSPLVDDYDDDMTQAGEDDLKKVTIQIKENLDSFQEMFRLQFGDPTSPSYGFENQNSGRGGGGGGGGGGGRGGGNGKGGGGTLVSINRFESEIEDLREEFQSMKNQQEDMSVRLQKDMKSVKSMLRQLLGKAPSDLMDYTEDAQVEPIREITPLSKMKRKKKKQPVTRGLDIETLEPVSSESSKHGSRSMLETESTEFSAAAFPELIQSVQPRVLDVTLSPTSSSHKHQHKKEDEASTTC